MKDSATDTTEFARLVRGTGGGFEEAGIKWSIRCTDRRDSLNEEVGHGM
jgi:hypothetical protein